MFAAYGWPPNLSDGEIIALLLALNLERPLSPIHVNCAGNHAERYPHIVISRQVDIASTPVILNAAERR